MDNQLNLSVISYSAKQEDFNSSLEMRVSFQVRGSEQTDYAKYIDDILLAIQELDIKKR